jgi:protease IV
MPRLPLSSALIRRPLSRRSRGGFGLVAARASTVAGAFLSTFSAAPARAQTADAEARPTRGIHLAGATRAGDADATGVELNPAQLGLLPAASLALGADLWSDVAALPGRGGAFLAAAPVGASGFGVGLSRVWATPRLGVEEHTTLRLAYGLRLGHFAALGASWGHVWGSRFGGTDTFDLGGSARAGRYAALGLVVEDVGAPAPAATRPLPRLWAADLTLRPLGTNRLEATVGATHAEGDLWRWIVPHARLSALVASGLRVFASGATLPRGTEFALSNGADYEAEVGLAVDLDHVGLTAAARGAFPGTGGGADSGGAALLLRAEGERRAPLVAPAYVARVKLDKIGSDAAFVDLVRRLRALATDRGAVAVLLRVDDLELGLGRIEELRDLVLAMRARGKRVYAYGAFPSMRAYYLATACDGVIIHPAGTLTLTGFSQTVTFYKHALDQLGVNVDLVRIGEFKGAMEPFIMNEQSPPVRDNKNALLDDVFGRVVSAIARARSGGPRGIVMDEARVRLLVDRGLFTPIEAQLVGLVDAVADDDQLEGTLRAALGRPRIQIHDPDRSPLEEPWPSRHVAIVLADGTIVDGPSQWLPFGLGTLAGSDSLVAALDACGRDATVGAVVLRVNSPGGSAFASDVVARAIIKLRKAGKPVVVSMGDLAASGGYYISAPADAIFAEPSTLSGSIGIFAYKADVRKLLTTLGIGSETYRRGLHADYESPYRPWNDVEIKIAAEKIRHFYELFLSTVVEGRRARGLTRARVDEIGRGHIWTGAQAQGLGLVDQMGGVSAAIDLAARLGHVPLGRDELPALTVMPRPKRGLLAQLAGLAQAGDTEGDLNDSDASDASGVAGALGSALAAAGTTSALRLLAPLLLDAGPSVQARLPYDIEIR